MMARQKGQARTGRLAALWLVAVAMCPGQEELAGKGASGEPRRTQLRDISSSQTFKNVNRNDARAAVKAWLDVVAREKGFAADARVDIVDSMAEVRERLQNRSVELVTLSIPDFLELESSGRIVPVLTDTRYGPSGALYSYVLLVHPSSGATTIGSLRGKNILVSSRYGSNTGLAWIEVMLGREKLGRAATYFASVKLPEKAQACILPLFFGSVDACVVDETSLNLAKELNPQLGSLKALARSRPMVETVIATPVEPYPLQKELIDALLTLHESVRGRQILTVFGTGRLTRLQAGDLDAARELWRDYYRLPGSAPNRPPVLAPLLESFTDRGKERH
jgi:ABC-type phosphate/phosphonate transport system substrate-binding protein